MHGALFTGLSAGFSAVLVDWIVIFATVQQKPEAQMRAPRACNLEHDDCNDFGSKQPRLSQFPVSAVPPATAAVTAALNPADRRSFEHLLGQALRETAAVTWATRAFASRMRTFIVGAAAMNGTVLASTALHAAFTTSAIGPQHAGYVGSSVHAIEGALKAGNIRESWALMYSLTKSGYFSRLLVDLLSHRPDGRQPLATPRSLGEAFGMHALQLEQQWALFRSTSRLPPALQLSQGMPVFEFQAFDSWVRFNFDAPSHGGGLLWRGARTRRTAGCAAVHNMYTDDASLEPPLSSAEQAAQCGREGARTAGRGNTLRACPLQWEPGESCFDIQNASWSLPGGDVVPGLAARAAALGYRSVAAVSGTAANLLQMATLLGFSADERVAIRLAMVAWLVPQDDHSWYEVMLGAETHLAPRHRMAPGLKDLGQLWPADLSVRTSDGHMLDAADVWTAVSRHLSSNEGRRLLAAMSEEARRYVRQLGKLGRRPSGERRWWRQRRYRHAI